MSNNQPSPVVVDEQGKPAPVMTREVKENSDKRMSGFMRSIQKRTSITGSANSEPPKPDGGDKGTGAAPVGTSEPKPIVQTPESKTDGQSAAPKVDDKGRTIEQPKPAINWEEEAKKHQSRADKALEQVKAFEGKKAIDESEYAELAKAKERVDAFVADPVGFMLKFTPQLAEQLANAGDPVKMIESEVTKFTQQLLTQFKSNLGEDWRFSEAEALQPGSPSFRYKLAVEEKVREVRDTHHRSVAEQQERMKNAEKSKAGDIARIKSEFGFTDDDIKAADKVLETIKTDYYNLYRLAMIDKIIERKLESLPPTLRPSPDLTQSPTSHEPATAKPQDLDKETKRIIARVGLKRFH